MPLPAAAVVAPHKEKKAAKAAAAPEIVIAQSPHHATFRQQAVQFFGAAPADVDPQDYILKLEADFRTQKNFFERLNKAPTVTVQGMPISGRWDSRRARQRKNFLFLAKEGADENFHSFATAFPEYFDPDGDLKPGPHNQLFYDFAEWTMREHPDWTRISHIDDHCGRTEPWEPPAWVLDMLPPIVALVVSAVHVSWTIVFSCGGRAGTKLTRT